MWNWNLSKSKSSSEVFFFWRKDTVVSITCWGSNSEKRLLYVVGMCLLTWIFCAIPRLGWAINPLFSRRYCNKLRQSLGHYYPCRIPSHGLYSIYIRWTPYSQNQILFFCTYKSCTVNEMWARILAELNHNSETLRLARKSYDWHFLNQVLNFAAWCLRTFMNNRKCFRELI